MLIKIKNNKVNYPRLEENEIVLKFFSLKSKLLTIFYRDNY
jgi:hypothetical protein